MQQPLNNSSTYESLPRRHQLRWRIILAFLFVSLTSIVITTALVLFLAAGQSRTQAYNQLESIAELKQNQIQRWLNDSQVALRILVADPFVDDIKNTLDINLSFENQAQISTILSDLAEVSSQAQQTNLNYKRLFLYTPDGTIVAASDARQIGQVVRTQPYFAASLTTPTVHPPFYRVGTEQLSMFVTQPIKNADNTVIAVVAGELNLDVLSELMQERSGLGESGETYLVSRESNYLLTPSRFPGYELNRSYTSEGIEQGLAGLEGQAMYDDYRSPPAEVIGVYRWIPELDAALLAEINVNEAFAGLNRGRLISLLFMAFMIVLMIGFGWWFARRISRPIQVLTDAAVKVAAGDLNERVVPSTKNEIGVLSQVFNRMTAELQQSQVLLEERVNQRTHELQSTLQEREQILHDLQESLSDRKRLQDAVRGLSMPVVPVLADIIVMPLVGEIDQKRSDMMVDTLLEGIETQHAKVALVDITGVPVIDSNSADVLLKMRRSAELLGTKVIFVGVHPNIAQTLMSLNVDVSALDTRSDLRSGIQAALRYLNRN